MIVLFAVSTTSVLSWISPPAVNSTSPVPCEIILMFWSVSALTVIVPELSSITFCPLTYKEPGPTYTSFHTLDAVPKLYVFDTLGIKLPDIAS